MKAASKYIFPVCLKEADRLELKPTARLGVLHGMNMWIEPSLGNVFHCEAHQASWLWRKKNRNKHQIMGCKINKLILKKDVNHLKLQSW